MPELLNPINEEEIIVINGKSYVKSSSAEKLVDNSYFIPLNFLRIGEYQIFYDDPAIGAMRRAFRNSQIKGPFYSDKELKKGTKSLKKRADNFYESFERATEVLSTAVSKQYFESLQITKHSRNSFLVKIDDMEYSFHHERIPEKYKELLKLYETIETQLKETGELKKLDENSLIAFVNGCFLEVIPYFYEKFENLHGLLIDSFSSDKSCLSRVLDIPFNYYLDKANSFEYDTHLSFEEFVGFRPLTISLKYNSIKNIIKKSSLLPRKLERLGKTN